MASLASRPAVGQSVALEHCVTSTTSRWSEADVLQGLSAAKGLLFLFLFVLLL